MTATSDLLAELVACDSTNPELVPGGAGEAALVDLIERRLSAGGVAIDRWDVAPGRPNLVATLKGTGDGRSLLLCSHGDVVAGRPEQFQPAIRDGRMYGRGTNDMKGGMAAAIVAFERIVQSGPLEGDLHLSIVCDEEWQSIGAEALVGRVRADAAIFPEQSGLDVVVEHGGFAWFELTSIGRQSAGIEPDVGVDAIALVGPLLAQIRELDQRLAEAPRASYGRGSIHASTISGGESYPVYPARCVVGIERCLIPGETWRQAELEVEEMIAATAAEDRDFQAELVRIVGRDPISLDPAEPVVQCLAAALEADLGRPATLRGDIGWMDSGVLADAGIPCVVFGPTGLGEHTDEEWVDLASLETVTRVLEETARRFCAAS